MVGETASTKVKAASRVLRVVLPFLYRAQGLSAWHTAQKTAALQEALEGFTGYVKPLQAENQK